MGGSESILGGMGGSESIFGESKLYTPSSMVETSVAFKPTREGGADSSILEGSTPRMFTNFLSGRAGGMMSPPGGGGCVPSPPTRPLTDGLVPGFRGRVGSALPS